MFGVRSCFLSGLRSFFPPAVYDADPPTDASTDSGPPDGPQTEDEDTEAPEGGDGASAEGYGRGAPRSRTDRASADERLSDEAAEYRVRAKTAEEALTTVNATIQELRLHNAFMRAALPLVDDLDAAWKLCDHSLVKVDEDGNVTGMDAMIAAALRTTRTSN